MSDEQTKYTKEKIIFYLGGFIAFIVSFIGYIKTMAPTVSFWDCGEFIACSEILGVPHPPGTPLFVLVGKFFMLLHIFSTPALNTNFISVIASAATVVMAYMLIVKVIGLIIKPQDFLSHIGINIGAFTGSLLMAFSSTYWFNAVETEVYSLAMFMFLAIIFLSIKWAEQRQAGGNDMLMVAIAYITFLSIGIHLTTFMIVPALILFFAIADREKARDWRFWLTWGILVSFALPLHFLIYFIIPPTADYPMTTWLAMVILFSGVCLWGLLKGSAKSKASWGLSLAVLAAALIGFSPHLYIPIRAAQSPRINENNPSNLRRFEDYMARKQYGQESMFTRMLKRRSMFKHQFGVYPHMGFWGYFREQYSADNWGFLRYIPFLFGLYGMFISLRKSFRNGFLISSIFLIGTLGLLIYLNFSDGTRGEQLEVRDRDYFYTPGFMMFAIIIGMGFAAFLPKFLSWLKSKLGNAPALAIWGAVAFIILIMPIDTMSYHWKTHDRTGDFMPPDYAYNILNSCDKDGILFTNGDNDTFPLWYLQEVEGVRRDVRVVNLSLLNTDWYIYQLKHQYNVPIDLDDDQINWLPYDKQGQITIYRPIKQFYDPIRKMNRFLVPFQDPKTGNVVRVQDQMIEHIVMVNKWKYPIYFATSVPNSNRWTLADYTIRKGMALQVVSEKVVDNMDAKTTENYLYNKYRYRGVSDLNIYKDENNVGLTTTYPERFMELAKYFADRGDTSKAKVVYWDCIAKFPYYYQSYIDLKGIYNAKNNADSAKITYDVGVRNLKAATDAWPEIVLYWQFLGIVHYAYENKPEAIKCYERSLELDPSNNISFRFLLQLYTMNNQQDKGSQLIDWWLSHHPDDRDALQMKGMYRRMPARG